MFEISPTRSCSRLPIAVMIYPLLISLISCIGPWSDTREGQVYYTTIGDIRRVAQALEAYHDEHGHYPPHAFGDRSVNGLQIPSYDLKWAHYLTNLKSGGPLKTLLNEDGFFVDRYAEDSRTFAYFSTGTIYVIWSKGPDGDYDLTLENLQNMIKKGELQDDWSLEPFRYDHVTSEGDGDIIRSSFPPF